MLLGDWIQLERRRNFSSQHEFASAINMSQTTVSLWENNKLLPNIPNLAQIAKSFGMSLKDVPFDRIENFEGVEETKKCEMKVHESLITIDGKEFHLKGVIGIAVDSGELQLLKTKGGIFNCLETK